MGDFAAACTASGYLRTGVPACPLHLAKPSSAVCSAMNTASNIAAAAASSRMLLDNRLATQSCPSKPEPCVFWLRLPVQLAEHFNAEVVAGTIGSTADAVDYLTWTFLFRRLLANPSYYDLAGTDADSLNAFLSALVEETLGALEVWQNHVWCLIHVSPLPLNGITHTSGRTEP